VEGSGFGLIWNIIPVLSLGTREYHGRSLNQNSRPQVSKLGTSTHEAQMINTRSLLSVYNYVKHVRHKTSKYWHKNNTVLETWIRRTSPLWGFNLKFKNIKLHRVNKDILFKAQTSCRGPCQCDVAPQNLQVKANADSRLYCLFRHNAQLYQDSHIHIFVKFRNVVSWLFQENWWKLTHQTQNLFIPRWIFYKEIFCWSSLAYTNVALIQMKGHE
jgi:hypothetical protein